MGPISIVAGGLISGLLPARRGAVSEVIIDGVAWLGRASHILSDGPFPIAPIVSIDGEAWHGSATVIDRSPISCRLRLDDVPSLAAVVRYEVAPRRLRCSMTLTNAASRPLRVEAGFEVVTPRFLPGGEGPVRATADDVPGGVGLAWGEGGRRIVIRGTKGAGGFTTREDAESVRVVSTLGAAKDVAVGACVTSDLDLAFEGGGG